MSALCEFCDGDNVCERCRQRVEITHLRGQIDEVKAAIAEVLDGHNEIVQSARAFAKQLDVMLP